MEKSYRIHTTLSNDAFLNVDMGQDFNFLEVLTLKLSQSDAYKLHSSNYGVIVGRVLANDAFGIPNAKVSVFIEKAANEDMYIESLYPYTSTMSKDRNGRRYNLLKDSSDDECYRVVGTFPSKRKTLDDSVVLEVYDKYYKYTTVTNPSGDYMIFGVPCGTQTVHVDIDLSDIGILSQKPIDMVYKGYNMTLFDNPKQFKDSSTLESLAQIMSQDKGVFVYPFWGDSDNGIASITRCDISLQYKFEPTCVFMGSIVSDNDSNAIGHDCAPHIKNGMNDQLVAGEGTIEMIRKTSDGLVEEFQIQGNQLINSDGVWCYQIPMNLDFIGMDEYGNIVPTDNPSKGIPTRAQVRFRISKNESGDEGFSRHTAKYLVPMSPMFDKDKETPTISVDGKEIEKMYQFGSSTPQSCFRDLYWNNVYSVKNYIPKVQVAHRSTTSNYSALKGANLATNQNQVPFNKLKIDIPFNYMIICIIFVIVMKIIGVINAILRTLCSIIRFPIPLGFTKIRPFAWIGCVPCISLNAGIDDGNVAFYPGCGCPTSEVCKRTSCPDEMGANCTKVSDDIKLEDKIQQNLGQEYNIVKLDLYQDWVNGVLYMPLWHWRKAKKKKFLFGLFKKHDAYNQFCDCDRTYTRLKTYVTCDVKYKDNDLTPKSINEKEDKWHKDVNGRVSFRRGLIKRVKNRDDLNVYYYAAVQATDKNQNPNMEMSRRKGPFKAVRLYATDIILLGNLNENNLYGIPQFFKSLPSTTSNVPAFAAIEESVGDSDVNQDTNAITAAREDTGTTMTAGMDWGARGGRDKPIYKNGLFLDLSCTYAVTKAKSCINVERLSEFGVNLDMTYMKSYANGSNNIEEGRIEADGFVTKLELDDEVNRAMFATMNHLGFVPQSYQDDNGTWYDTQVEDKATNYLIPKFRYIYPVDFDGRMQELMDRYRNGFKQAMYDVKDQSYLTFRLGAERGGGGDTGVRHFYLNNQDGLSMPLYNNSFYFFFGINKGKTAIEKFKEMFDAECFQNVKFPFTLDVEARGRSFCDDIYLDEYKDQAYAYIHINVDDIQTPFTYTLYDSSNAVVINETSMDVTDFAIGGTVSSGVVTAFPKVVYQYDGATEVDNRYGRSGLTNQVYTLEVVDSNFKKVRTRVDVRQVGMDMQYTAYKLGTKFYDQGTTPIDYIYENKLSGKIIISGFSIDGYEFTIDSVDGDPIITNKSITYTLIGVNNDQDSILKPVKVVFKFSLQDSSLNIDDVMWCVNSPDWDMRALDIGTVVDDEGEHNINILLLKVDRPSSWMIQMTPYCEDRLSVGDTVYESFTIANGESFVTYLNEMPTKFMIGDGSKFYSSTLVTSITDASFAGWFGVHQEDTFLFSDPRLLPVNRNQDLWEEYVSIDYDMDTPGTKQAILKFKFDALFSLSQGVYVTDGSNTTLRYTANGGTQPTLFRCFAPFYDASNGVTDSLKKYILTDENAVTVDESIPNIVGYNYGKKPIVTSTSTPPQFSSLPRFNDRYTYANAVGNYFAAFTDDGDGISIPQNADVIAEKTKGTDIIATVADYPQVYNSNSYLRGLFVDRRLDYDLWIFTPFNGTTVDITVDGNTWNYSRIMGFIYNGIEMSYDVSRNLISASTEYDDGGDAVSADVRTLLEYSYSFDGGSDGSEKTVYNDIMSNQVIWERDFEPNDYEGKQINKRFYSARYNGNDIRDYFWSSFNKDRLEEYATSADNPFPGTTGDNDGGVYVFSGHSQDDGMLYNGDFNRESAFLGGYPIVRYLDVMNMDEEDNYVRLDIVSCSYNVDVESDEGTIKAKAEEGEEADISFDFGNIIEFSPLNEDDQETVNAYSHYNESDTTSVDGIGTFVHESCMMCFSYMPRTEEGYIIKTSLPSIVRVLPGFDGLDGITYLKMAKDESDFRLRLEEATFSEFGPDTKKQYGSHEVPVKLQTIVKPSSVGISTGYLSTPTTNNNYSKVRFIKYDKDPFETIKIDGIDVFSIEYENVYECNDGTNLSKSIHTVEFSDMYDVRDISMGISSGECFHVDGSGVTHTGGGEQDSDWTHRLGFIVDVKRSKCKIFEHPEILNFSFRFRRKRGPFYLPASEVNYEYEGEQLSKIHVIVDWTEDMNLGDDAKWQRNMMFVKTQDGFTYGMQFGLIFNGLDNAAPIMTQGQHM